MRLVLQMLTGHGMSIQEGQPGYIFTVNDVAFSWKYSLQGVVSDFSKETKYIAQELYTGRQFGFES